MTMLSSILQLGSIASARSTQELLTKPLIIGASVSAGYRAVSPGKQLALRYTSSKEIKTLAYNGRAGRDILKLVSDRDFHDRTIVIGIDLFFWDSVYGSADDSIKAINSLVRRIAASNLPLVLAKVPNLLGALQPNLERINRELTRACASYRQCYLLPSDEIFQQILEKGHLEYKGKRYGLSELLPDGIHIGPSASQYLADELLELLSARQAS